MKHESERDVQLDMTGERESGRRLNGGNHKQKKIVILMDLMVTLRRVCDKMDGEVEHQSERCSFSFPPLSLKLLIRHSGLMNV